MRFLGLALLLTVVPLIPGAAAGQAHFPADDDLGLMLRYLVEDGESPGVVLGVVEPDGSTRVVAYGSAGPDGRPVGPGSVFEIGSITKTFTATLLADMVLKGEVALEDPVSTYLPDHVTVPSRDGREITLHDLATHRSGLPTVPDDFDEPGPDSSWTPYTVEDAYAFLSRYELRHRPGARYEYSNFGFGLLGHALGRAAGSSYQDLVRTRVLEPLGMDRTGFEPEGDAAERLARGHRNGEPVRHRPDMEIFDGSGALRSTAEDLLEYAAAQVRPPRTDLERAMRLAREGRVPVRTGGELPAPDGDERRGLAWGTLLFPGEGPVFAHGGGTAGFKSQISLMPDRGMAIIVLANDAFFDDDLATSLLYPDPTPASWEEVAVDSTTLARYAGEYEPASGDGAYYVRLEADGHLTYQPRGKVRARLYARSDSTFYLLRGPWSFTFRSGAAGEVGMIMEVDEREPRQEGMRRTARKVKEDTPPSTVVAGNAGFWASRGVGKWGLIGLGVVVALAVGLRLLRSRRRRIGSAAAVLLIVGTAGCEAGQDRRAAFTERDSAGIRIAESAR